MRDALPLPSRVIHYLRRILHIDTPITSSVSSHLRHLQHLQRLQQNVISRYRYPIGFELEVTTESSQSGCDKDR
ncbi:hypothetical protein F2P81_023134 [Scophthalmus maximus]|uniref:Uncharacterized protein n=1 Tax=Scophthalmus maximus TaxID=52904 RepID=A0A6A4RYU7_SCOMX|nr:hypothetical protein F2P81_023134 [Scophthalmus maximus]